MAADAGLGGAHQLLLQHQGDAANDHRLSHSQGNALPGWNALGAHVGTVGAAQILDLDNRPDMKRGVLTRRTRVGNANIGVVVTTD